jgi:hypothetical protein
MELAPTEKVSPQLPPKKANLGGIDASLEDRWTGLGITGSGKTVWAKQLIHRLRANYPGARTYILDSKDAGDFDDLAGQRVTGQHAPDSLRTAGQTQIWQPPLNDLGQYHQWFMNILRAKKPSIVLVDELASLGGSRPNTFPQGYALLMKQGRRLEMCVISLTQEAAYVPRQTFGQLTHLVRFRLENDYDRRMAAKHLNIEKDREPRHAYGFFYKRLDRPGQAHEYRDWQEFF